MSMTTRKDIPLTLFKFGCDEGPSSYVSRQGIYLVGGEPGHTTACAIYPIEKVIVGDKVYVRIPEEYGSPEYQVYSRTKRKGLSGAARTSPVHVEGDLWVITVMEADDDGWIYLYSLTGSPPKIYIAVGFNVKPLTFNEQLTRVVAGAAIGGVIGAVFKPIGPTVSPLIGALGGAGLGYGAGYAAEYAPTHLKGFCPVCGVKVADRPLGEDVRCPSCGFVSAYTR